MTQQEYQVLKDANIGDLVTELHRRGYRYNPKYLEEYQREERHKQTENNFILIIRFVLVGLLLIGLGIMFYILLSV